MIEISYVSIFVSMLLSILSFLHSIKKGIRQDSADIVTVIVKLENIGLDISEIKNDLKNIRSEVKTNSNKITAIEKDIEHIYNRLGYYEESCKDCRDKNNLK